MYRQWEHVSMSMLAFSSKHQLLPNAHGLTEQRGCLYTLNPVKIIETRIAQMKLWKTVVALCTENTRGESQKNPGIEWEMWEVWANKWLHSGLRLAGTLKCSIFFRTRRITCLHLRSENGVALSLIHRGETECYTLSTLGWGGGVWRGEAAVLMSALSVCVHLRRNCGAWISPRTANCEWTLQLIKTLRVTQSFADAFQHTPVKHTRLDVISWIQSWIIPIRASTVIKGANNFSWKEFFIKLSRTSCNWFSGLATCEDIV